MSVSMNPGATTLTVMSRDPTSVSHRLREADDRCFRCGVVGLAGIPRDPGDRTHRNDPAPLEPQHAAQGRLRAQVDGSKIRLDHVVPCVDSHAKEEIVASDSGVVHENPDAAQPLFDLGEHGGHRFGIADIRLDGKACAPAGDNRLDDIVGSADASV